MVSLIDLQLSYVLAFMGQVQIAESLSSTIASTVVGVMLGYFFKALFETFFEKREERLKQESEPEENTNYEEAYQFFDYSTVDRIRYHESDSGGH